MRKSITLTVTQLLAVTDDATRLYAAGSLGALCKCFPDDELAAVLRDYMLDDDVNADWTLRHGRSVALSVALSEVPQRVLAGHADRVVKTLLSYLASDRIPLVTSGAKGVAFYLKHAVDEQIELPAHLITAFAKVLARHWRGTVAALSQHCRSSATTLPQLCRSIAAALQLPLARVCPRMHIT